MTNNTSALKELMRRITETLYLLSVPGMRERLMKAKDTPYEECDEFAW